MRNLAKIFLILCMQAGFASGHGTPLQVQVVNSQLIASHPIEPGQFAPPIFGENDEDGDYLTTTFVPTTGNTILWQLPGLEITGMTSTSSLSLEVLARPIASSPSNEKRVLWYWNPLDESVEQSPAEFHLFGMGQRFATLEPNQSESETFLLTNTVANHTGFHNHGLLNYGLDDDNIAPAGVYGFFARLSSNSYTSSDPFLVVFNYFTDYESIIDASLAIFAEGTLAGDFDLDDDVDGRDFLTWQRLAGSTTRTVADISLNGLVDTPDLVIWRNLFGDSEQLTAATQIPEPSAAVMLIVLAALAYMHHRRGLVIQSTANDFR